MTDPKLIDLAAAYPDRGLDRHDLAEAIERGAARCAKDIPTRYADANVDNPEVARWVRALADETVERMRGFVPAVTQGPSLLLLGPTGTGKTHQAYGAIRAIAVSGLHCSWLATTAADVYACLRPRPKVDSELEFERFAGARLLLLDDLGAAKASEWTEEVNYRLINHRYEHRLPTIITSNVAVKSLREEIGERVASRLVEMCQRVTLKGDDRRRSRGAA
ncbi:MAG TPA: ATP-binding protein [Pseudonocardiaceae bacterium]|jgi:DNA replication protein DnaC|nr:ATP-binding protein [Pseudonocardiaceae bacterium]